MSQSVWFPMLRRVSPECLRLFCFPYAGGGTSVYGNWGQHLSDDVSLFGVQLPGRERRFREAPLDRAVEVVDRLCQEIIPFLDCPCVFFGHSIGALLAYELTCRLQEQNRPLPAHLIVSGKAAPHRPRSASPIHQLPDDEFIAELRTYAGTPEEVLRDRELMRLLLPTLRADFALAETYEFTSRAPLRCPITALGGQGDPWVCEDDLTAWRMLAAETFEWKLFDGDHFFLHDGREALVGEVDRIVRAAGRAGARCPAYGTLRAPTLDP